MNTNNNIGGSNTQTRLDVYRNRSPEWRYRINGIDIIGYNRQPLLLSLGTLVHEESSIILNIGVRRIFCRVQHIFLYGSTKQLATHLFDISLITHYEYKKYSE